jgi:hypothetical protein
MQKLILVICALVIYANTSAQTLEVKADNYLQNFEGAGISAGLYLGHHYSMPNANSRDSAVRFIAQDLNMRYLQDYININPADDPAYFDRRADYIKAAKLYRPDIQVSQVGNKFPADLMIDSFVAGATRRCLNTKDPLIYTKVASWYFELCKAFKLRGVEVDILNVVNEPDFDKVYYYGASGNTKQNVAFIFDSAVTRFLGMLANPAINTLQIKVPKIMGPSTISPQGCVEYIQYFKQNYPNVFALIDIVSYHQYVNGVNVNQLAAVKSEAGANKLVYQSEMHTNRGDALGTLPIADSLRGCLSLASLFGNSLRTGCNSWFYFQTNYPDTFTPAGLLSVPWQAATPKPYKQYYAFQQLTSTPPINSRVLEHAKASLSTVDIVCLRKQNTDTVYVNATNTANTARTITINVSSGTGRYNILKYQMRTTDATRNNNAAPEVQLGSPQTQFAVTIAPYSVNTLTIAIQKAILPVKWLSTNANLTSNKQAALTWAVFETDVSYYEIQKSIDGQNFYALGNIASKGNGNHNYSFVENIKVKGKQYYRILQKNYDGSTSYSSVMLLNVTPKNSITVYPNPTKNIFVINSNQLQNTTAVIINTTGQIVQNLSITQSNTMVNATNYASGIYWLKFASGETIKLIKQ